MQAAANDDLTNAQSNAPVPPSVGDSAFSPNDEALREQARTIVRSLEEASGSKELAMMDGMSNLGIQTQRRAGEELDLLRNRVGAMLSSDGTGSKVAKDMIELREALTRIDPNASTSGITRFVPFASGLKQRLERIAIRYEGVSRQVVTIERRLQEGRTMLRRDNIELRKLYESVEEQQEPIIQNVQLGEFLMEELSTLLERTSDEERRARIQSALFEVAARVQDLRTMLEVHAQFFVSIEMTRQNNTRLGQAVERTMALTTNTLMVGLAIQSALDRQKRVLEATERTRQFLGDLILSNASSIRRHTSEIGNVYVNPVVAIEKLTRAHEELTEALSVAHRLETEGIATAQANIQQLSNLTEALTRKKSEARGGLLAEESVEAS